MYIAYEIKSWPYHFDIGFTLKKFFIQFVKHSYSGCGISFDVCGTFSLPNRSFGKNVVIFGADMSSSRHFNNQKRYLYSW